MSSEALQRLLYSRKEAAYLLSLSVRQLDRFIANKEIGFRQIGGRKQIPHGELVRFARADHFTYPAGSRRQQDAAEPGERTELSA